MDDRPKELNGVSIANVSRHSISAFFAGDRIDLGYELWTLEFALLRDDFESGDTKRWTQTMP